MLNTPNAVQKPDFNGDGKTDLFWRSPVTNQTAVWLMDGTQLLQGSFLADVPVTNGWDDPAFGDFNGDGKTDLFWRNSLTGENAIWLMEGVRLLEGQFIEPVKQGGTALLGDFNNDQKTDILWHIPAEGLVSIWEIDGTTVAETLLLQPLGELWTAKLGDLMAIARRICCGAIAAMGRRWFGF
ncbi:MAG: VCBS repeat-containing protein [Alkalinema sp. RU_4_3]|nr:VCBS repeat-containing protein [Alkalinema sp. RU_4_3]